MLLLSPLHVFYAHVTSPRTLKSHPLTRDISTFTSNRKKCPGGGRRNDSPGDCPDAENHSFRGNSAQQTRFTNCLETKQTPMVFWKCRSGAEKDFLSPLPNKWLPGVGPKLSGILNSAGLASIRQIGSTPTDLLSLIVGSYAPQLKQFANSNT